MLIDALELQLAKDKCPALLESLLYSCGIKEGLLIFNDASLHEVSLNIEEYVSSLVGAEDSLDAFILLLKPFGYSSNDLARRSYNTLLEMTLDRKGQIVERFGKQ